MSDQPQITVVIPALGGYDVLARVLDGFERQDAAAADFEVLVVADAADPDPEAMRVTAAKHRVRLLRGDRPGPSASRNVGWRESEAPLVLFTDSDTVPAPALICEHLKWHRLHPAEAVAVTGLVRWAPEVKVTSFMRWLEQGVQFDFDGIDGTHASWAHVYTANCSVKRALLERVGGFDSERLPYGYEDLDWGYRARQHGLDVRFNRAAVVNHLRTMTVADWQARAPRLAVSEWRFCELHPDIEPWFYRQFAQAAGRPPGGRRSAALTGLIPRATPLLGRLVWDRATLHWRQQIAPYFLDAWERAAAGQAPELQPAVSAFNERSRSSSSGSPPSGP